MTFVFISCSKESPIDESTSLDTEELLEGITTHEYIYKGNSYIIQYDESDELGQPLPSKALNTFTEAIGNKEYYSVRDANNLYKVTIYDTEAEFNNAMGYNETILEGLQGIEDGEVINQEKTAASSRSPLMMYFEHSRFAGNSLCGDDVSGIACRGNDCCGKLWHRSDLRTVPRGSGGNWNDVITSLKVDPSSIITNKSDKVAIVFYRDAGFPQSGCKKEGFTMNSTGLSISSLRSFRWCTFGGRLNDDINGWTLTICKAECNDCWRNR